MSNEKQTCPSRVAQQGAPEEHLDEWEVNRWDKTRDSIKWELDWQPRTCSYCGCIYPDDLMKLLKLKWELEPSTKNYKVYVQSPGYYEWTKYLLNQTRNEGFENIDWTKKNPDPIPPVKIYTWHYNKEQLEILNGVLTSQRSVKQ